MTAGVDQKARWKMVRQLLHVDDQCDDLTPDDAWRLSTGFVKFFSNKLHRVADEVKRSVGKDCGHL